MKNILVYYLLFIALNIHAQKHDYIWQMGTGGTVFNPASLINFNYSNDSTYIINRPNVDRTNASICDSLGNFLFYTNGIQVIDSSYQVMLNGDSLNPGWVADDWSSNGYGYPFTEAALILPVPQHDSLYHIYHISISDAVVYSNGLLYTVVNMNGNNGKGEVVSKNQMLIADSLSLELEAMKHANGEDWWIMVTETYQNGFYRFLLTKDSIAGPFYQQIGASMHEDNNFSQAVFSPDGTKFARYDKFNDLDIFDFDRCTGLLSNPQKVVIQDTADNIPGLVISGLAFSPSSQYLYVNSGALMVYQFDIWASNIAASMDTVAIYDGYYQVTSSNASHFFLGALAPNGKIYFNSWGNLDVLHVIHSPDSAGAACNFEQHGFQLASAGLTMPNFPHFRTPALSVPCDTMTSNIVIEDVKEDWAKVYPNPTSSNLFVESSQNIETILIYNNLGQQVYVQSNIELRHTSISTQKLENGVYWIEIQNGKRSMNRSFQVLR